MRLYGRVMMLLRDFTGTRHGSSSNRRRWSHLYPDWNREKQVDHEDATASFYKPNWKSLCTPVTVLVMASVFSLVWFVLSK